MSSPLPGPAHPLHASPRNALTVRALLRLVALAASLACATLVAVCVTVLSHEATALTAGRRGAVAAGRGLRHDAYLVAGAGSLLLVVVLVVLLTVSGAIVRRAQRTQTIALAVAQHQLPELIRRLKHGEAVDTSALPRPTGHGDEFGVISDALARLAQLAGDSAYTLYRERDGFDRFAMSAATRSLVAADFALEGLETLQHRPGFDAATKNDLAAVDHRLVQLRRQLENLLLLTGGTIPHPHTQPVPVGNLLLDAIGEVTDRSRVRLDFGAEGAVIPEAAGALTHLLAELTENALAYSAPHLPVIVRSAPTGSGIAFEVEDRGKGLTPEALDELNRRLQVAPLFAELADIQQLGLFVVGKLTVPFGLSVRLRPSDFGGVSALVLIPDRLLTQPASAEPAPPPPAAAADRADHTAPSLPAVPAEQRPSLSLVTASPGRQLTTDGLPQRVPGANLAAPLRQPAPTDEPRVGGYGIDDRSAEDLSDLFAHFPTPGE
ncbi:signal transduction histidine kinase [Streptacidiphilus sp. BW17]|uniref:sensor histidine kinase n=1 Tax=Streptacidiphilus sp. BW17 TaxID=3156274 RepID=UPI0035159DAF